MNDSQQTLNSGRVAQVIGPVIDVMFAKGQVPNIYNALVLNSQNAAGLNVSVTVEVQVRL